MNDLLNNILPLALANGNEEDYYKIVVTIAPELEEIYEHNADQIII